MVVLFLTNLLVVFLFCFVLNVNIFSKPVFGLNNPTIIIIWRRQWQATPVLLPRKSHGRRSLVGFSPWGRKESDMTEQLNWTDEDLECHAKQPRQHIKKQRHYSVNKGPYSQGNGFPSSHVWIGEGKINLLQYSCLENPRDGRAWWAAIYGVAQSRTQLKRLSSSSSIIIIIILQYNLLLFSFVFTSKLRKLLPQGSG